MRQKLINKIGKGGVKAGISNSLQKIHSPNKKLHSLLFDSGIGKDAWTKGIKEHSKILIDTLLNNEIDDFEEYIADHFSDLAQNPEMLTRIQSSGLMQINQRKFLQEFLQLAVLIEHSTIPPYLTAMYSIKEGTNTTANGIIRSVVVEEMLHMIMVCNVMNAIDIVPSVNKPQNYPSYPLKLPLNVDFYVGLEKFSSNSIATFIAIESPNSPKVEAPNFNAAPELEPEEDDAALLSVKSSGETEDLWTLENLNEFLSNNVNTIGEFYDVLFFFIVVFQSMEFYKNTGKLPTSFDDINTGGLFTGNEELQIGSEHYYGSGGKLYKVVDLKGVMQVFEEIKGQGEGADDTIFDIDTSQFEEGAELAHYFRFKEIFHEHYYIGGDYAPFTDENGQMPVITPPVGKAMKVDWDATYPMKANVKMSDYASNAALYAQGKAFNETYKKLLDAIQGAVEGRQEELSDSVIYMFALRDQAVELMKQPLTGTENAGPTYEYPTN